MIQALVLVCTRVLLHVACGMSLPWSGMVCMDRTGPLQTSLPQLQGGPKPHARCLHVSVHALVLSMLLKGLTHIWGLVQNVVGTENHTNNVSAPQKTSKIPAGTTANAPQPIAA